MFLKFLPTHNFNFFLPAAHFSTFGFAQRTSRPFTKSKELKFSNALLKLCKTFCGLFMSISIEFLSLDKICPEWQA
jgi:hypothetical protein